MGSAPSTSLSIMLFQGLWMNENDSSFGIRKQLRCHGYAYCQVAGTGNLSSKGGLACSAVDLLIQVIFWIYIYILFPFIIMRMRRIAWKAALDSNYGFLFTDLCSLERKMHIRVCICGAMPLIKSVVLRVVRVYVRIYAAEVSLGKSY